MLFSILSPNDLKLILLVLVAHLKAKDPEVGADSALLDDNPNMVDLEANIDDEIEEGDDNTLDLDKGE